MICFLDSHITQMATQLSTKYLALRATRHALMKYELLLLDLPVSQVIDLFLLVHRLVGRLSSQLGFQRKNPTK